MIYLIGGPPWCGKTIVAKRLAEKLGIGHQTADMLESVVQAYFSGEDFSRMFPKQIMRQKTNDSNDAMYSQYSTNEIVEAYKVQARTVWPAIRVLVEHACSRGIDFVIDGHHIHPEFVEQMQKEFPNSKIVGAFIIKLDEAAIVEGTKQNPASFDWAKDKTEDEGTYSKIAAMVKAYGAWVKKEAEKRNYLVFDLSHNFEESIAHTIEQLTHEGKHV